MLPPVVAALEKDFLLAEEHLHRIVNEFRTEFEDGLAKYGQGEYRLVGPDCNSHQLTYSHQTWQWYPASSPMSLTGQKQGENLYAICVLGLILTPSVSCSTFLALDLGGTNLLVSSLK